VVLPGAGHLANLESPADFSEALQNFLLSNL
jgi:pimeloyl-ACP methyl ester carboxylesterase